MRILLLVELLFLPGAAAAAADDSRVPPRSATVVLCDTTPVDSAYALAIAESYARILDPNAAPAKCGSNRPNLPPDGFDALLVVTFEKTDLERPGFSGELELIAVSGRWARCHFIAQRRKIPDRDHVSSTERLGLSSGMRRLAFDLGLIPDPYPNVPPDDLPADEGTMDLPPPSRTD